MKKAAIEIGSLCMLIGRGLLAEEAKEIDREGSESRFARALPRFPPESLVSSDDHPTRDRAPLTCNQGIQIA